MMKGKTLGVKQAFTIPQHAYAPKQSVHPLETLMCDCTFISFSTIQDDKADMKVKCRTQKDHVKLNYSTAGVCVMNVILRVML